MSRVKVEGNLEDIIRAAAAAGELTYISLAPCAGKGPNGIGWAAVYSPASCWGQGFGRDDDPVQAIKLAINDPRMSEIVGGLRKTLKKGAANGNKASAKALAENLPADVDDSDFLGT